ncbi:MAG: succinylglutamate desuccinylase/aspartoacylase family protein, partial [Candidatus Caldatribacteriota bacterium]|nr:succinylglutamate desuccinylase/aspartoacylase family protein [Candidatus Caldatribacteriota bacterium]
MIYKKNISKTIFISLILLILCIPHIAAASSAETKYICIGTDFETPVHIIKTETRKPVVMIIAGTHGNEPAGIAAVNYLKDSLNIKKGTLLMITRANILACKKEVRNYPKDVKLNRVYPGNKRGNGVEKIAYEIFNLMKSHDIDFLIDLHESREFYKINS